MTQNQTPVTTTEHKIGKVTYLVCSSASERATDTLDKKIKKLIRKDMELNPANARKLGVSSHFIHDTGSGMWYNIDSTNTMLVCRRKGGQNVTDRQDYRFILQIEPGR